MTTALLLLDFINEIVHEEGKLSKKGYSVFIKERQTFERLAQLTRKARERGIFLIHVKVGFSPNYVEQLKRSPLFGQAQQFEALKLGTWATDFHELIDVQEKDPVVIKHRVGAFYSTRLEAILNANNVDSLLLAGVATDLVVATTARNAHDRGYKVIVVADCCAAATAEDHETALNLLQKVAIIKNVSEV